MESSLKVIIVFDADVCGENYLSAPRTIITRTPEGQEYYGFQTATATPDYATPFLIEHVAQDNIKPDLGFDYSIRSTLIANGYNYFSHYSYDDDTTFKSYPAFTEGEHEFRVSTGLTSTFNGMSESQFKFIAGSRSVREILPAQNINEMPDLPEATYANIEFDSTTRILSLESDVASNFGNMTYVYSRLITSSGERLRWYVYSPRTLQLPLPKLEAEYEALYADSYLDIMSAYIIKDNNDSEYVNALKMRRFNDPVTNLRSSRYSEATVNGSYYDLTRNMQANKKFTTEKVPQNIKLENEVLDLVR